MMRQQIDRARSCFNELLQVHNAIAKFQNGGLISRPEQELRAEAHALAELNSVRTREAILALLDLQIGVAERLYGTGEEVKC